MTSLQDKACQGLLSQGVKSSKLKLLISLLKNILIILMKLFPYSIYYRIFKVTFKFKTFLTLYC